MCGCLYLCACICLDFFFSAQDFVLCKYFDYYYEKWKGGETAQIMCQKMSHETLTRHVLYAPSVDDGIVTSPLIFISVQEQQTVHNRLNRLYENLKPYFAYIEPYTVSSVVVFPSHTSNHTL